MVEESSSSISTYNVAFLHEKFGKRHEDSYIIDLALALKATNNNITIYTTYLQQEVLDSIRPLHDVIKVSGDWIPTSICGAFRRLFSLYKTMWLTIQLLLNPPDPYPNVVILDTDTLALFVLSHVTNYKTLYIHHFPHLRCTDYYYSNMKISSDLLTMKTIGYADEVIVQTKCLQEVFARSFPNLKPAVVLMPSYSTGLWSENTIEVRRIVPDLPTNHKIFVAFGELKRRSNFMLLLEALEQLISVTDTSLKEEIHVVISGSCKGNDVEYFDSLIKMAKNKHYAPKVSFLRQLPTIHKKSLMEAATAVIHLVNHDLYPGPIIAAMSLAKPIITVDCGFASTVLAHRITGIFVEPEPYKIAMVMVKIAKSVTLQTFLGNMAKTEYKNKYSFQIFCEEINSLCGKTMQDAITNQ